MIEELRAIAQATIKRRRVYGPSGKFIMHGVPAVRFCKRCGGYVTKWHEHYTDHKNKGDAVLAQSLWMTPVSGDPPKKRLTTQSPKRDT